MNGPPGAPQADAGEDARRFDEFAQLSSDWYWEQDDQLRFTYFSREFEALTNIDLRGVLGRTRWEGLGEGAGALDGVDWDGHRATLEARLPFRDFEYPSRRSPGRIVWFRTSGKPRFDEDGRFRGYVGVARDITARRHTEEELHRVNAEQRAILENASLGILFTRGQRIGSCNPSAAQILGYGERELVGEPEVRLHPSQESYDRLGIAAWPMLSAGSSFEAEIQMRRKDGGLVWVRAFARAIDPQQADAGTIWLIEDVTERRLNEEALRRTRHEMEAVMENASVGILFTRDRRLTRYNRRFAELFGFRADEGVGMAGRELYPSQAAYDELGRRATPLLSVGQPFKTELTMRRQDGSTFWAQLIGYVVDPGDPSQGTIWVIDDRSAQRRGEEALEAGLRKLSHAVEQSPAATLITDTEGRIEYVNPKFTEVSGYSLAELAGKTPAVIRSGLTPAPVYAELWSAIRAGREWRGEIQNRRKNGELYWESEVISPLKDERGTIVNFIAVKEDITERKRAQLELLQLNRTLRLISECNQSLVMSRSEPELLDAVCRIIVGMGGYAFAWVGFAERDAGRRIVPAATAGVAAASFEAVLGDASWGEGPSSLLPAARAIRTGLPYIGHDLLADPAFPEAWRAAWSQHGVAAAISMPLKSGGVAFGALTIYSRQAEAFTADEAKLLQEMADDLAYGIGSLRLSEEHRAAAARVESLLAEQESVLENIGVGIAFLRQRRIMRCNRGFEAMFGYAREEIVDRETDFLHDSGAAGREQATAVYALVEQGGQASGDIRLRHRDGSALWASHTLTAIDRNDPGKGVIWVVQDITARKLSEEAMRIRDRAIESSIHGIVISDSCGPDRPVVYVNPAFERITGYAAQDALGRNARFLVGDMGQIGLAEARSALREGRSAQVVIRCVRKDGSLFWNELSLAPVRDEAGRVTHVVSIINDVTERVRYEEELARQANHDFLTGLANRNLLVDRLEQSLAGARRYGRAMAVVFLDLDQFKMVNDSLGHRAGDDLLRGVAQRLSGCVRGADTLARLGGDEFVILLDDVDGAEAVAGMMQRMQEAMAGAFRVEGHEIYVTCSLGASVFPRDGLDGDTLLKNADAAMYRAKESGRNNFRFYAAEMNAAVKARLTVATGLRRALERDEFELHYQPIADLASGRIIGAEALVRWKHPARGLLSAGEFIPTAEETGTIVRIGRWSLDAACAQSAAWQRDGLPPVTMAVNLSARQFHQEDLADMVRQALGRHGVPPDRLELELTESALMQNVPGAVATMRSLRELGVRLALDDFGTGYSSLNYLRRFPFDKLKIDKSFVREIATDADGAAMVTAIISMGKTLKLQVVAEGVESREELDFLRRDRCDAIQGYLFRPPVPAGEFAAMLRAGATLEG